MPLLVRKVDKGKWMQNDIVNGADVSADAITHCMRTANNKISVWEIDSEGNSEEAVLAMVAAHEHLETIDVVLMNRDYLTENGINCVNSEGRTAVTDLINRHRDLDSLTFKKLGIIAYHIVDGIKNDKIKRYTIGQQKEILKKAISTSRLNPDDLKNSVKEKLN